MQPFLVLLGQIFLIAVLHSMLDVFLTADGNQFMGKLVNVACYLGSLYLLLNFIFEHILGELTTMINLTF